MDGGAPIWRSCSVRVVGPTHGPLQARCAPKDLAPICSDKLLSSGLRDETAVLSSIEPYILFVFFVLFVLFFVKRAHICIKNRKIFANW